MDDVEVVALTPLQWIADFGMSMIPPILVGLIFFIVMRSIFRADSTERKVYSQIEAEERAKRQKAPNA
jgi:hypothetical protein